MSELRQYILAVDTFFSGIVINSYRYDYHYYYTQHSTRAAVN